MADSQDFFGQTKSVFAPGNIVSYSMVLVSVGEGNLCLAQDVNVTYGRNVIPQYELGSECVWLVAGAASGQCTISRALGKKDKTEAQMWKAFKTDDACKGVTIKISKGEGGCSSLDPGGLIMENSFLTSMTASISVGQLIVTEQATYTVGKVALNS